MNDPSPVARLVRSFETTRRARDQVLLLSLIEGTFLAALSATAFLTAPDVPPYFDTGEATVVSLALSVGGVTFARLSYLTVRLARELEDRRFLMTHELPKHPTLYMLTRLIGFGRCVKI